MTAKMTYTGLLTEQALFQTFAFIAFVPDVDIDKKHGAITYSDPNDAKNKIVIDVDDLAVQNGVATSGFVTSVSFTTQGKDALDLTGLHIDMSGHTIAINNNSADFYSLLADNVTGAVVSTGDKYDNNLEVGSGAGKAVVNAGDGNDVIYIWHHKDVVIDGGKGIDLIDFDSMAAANVAVSGDVKIDLAKGTGTNPFGGTLTIKNVENLEAASGAADFRGDIHDNVLIGSRNADILMGRGGDDMIKMQAINSADPRATHADGGSGHDTLFANLTENAIGAVMTNDNGVIEYHNTLDLENPDNNTGTFHGATIKNFEVYQAAADWSAVVFDFKGSEKGETAQGSLGNDNLDGRGGDDVLYGFLGADDLTGGAGADHFQFQGSFDSTVDASGQDTIEDFKHAQHDKIDLSHMSPRLNFSNQYDFIGTKAFDGKSSEVRFEHDGQGNTIVQINDTADKTADMQIVLVGDIDLVKGDFML